MFTSVVIPVLLYGCSEIWGTSLLGKMSTYKLFKDKLFNIVKKLELLLLKYFKRILGVQSTNFCTESLWYRSQYIDIDIGREGKER